MGGFNPITAVLNPLGTLLGTAFDTYKTADAYDYARKSYEIQQKQIDADAASQRKQLALESEKDATDRRNALKRAMAKQKTLFGGQGIDSSDGSGEAVLLGLLQENEEDKTYRERLDKLKREALAQETTNKSRRNLLTLQNNYASARNSVAGDIFGV